MLIRFLLILLVVYGLMLVLLYFFQPRLLFLPDIPGRGLQASPDDVGLVHESVEFRTADGETLHGWWLPHERARATLLFQHGNAGNISHRLDSLRLFHQLGLNVFIYDYRGYGRSTGSPSERGLYVDAEAAWTYLVDERGIAAGDIVLFGRSLGGAVASRLATEVDAAGLIVESAFTSVPDIGSELYRWLPVRLLSRMDFDTRDYVARAGMPVLVVHSPDDDIIPFHHAEGLLEAAGERGRLLEISGDHNTGFLFSREAYLTGFDEFLTEITSR